MKKYVWPGIALVLAVLLLMSFNIRSEQRALLPEDHPIATTLKDYAPSPVLIESKPTGIGNELAMDEPIPLSGSGGPGMAAPGIAAPGMPGNSRGNGLNLEQHAEIAQVLTELRVVNDDPKKAELTKQLESAIVAIFDKDMSSRETDLSQLEERLTKLRAQLDRRRKAKSEIIQLQIKLMVNEADGLGFSGTPAINGRQ